MYLQPNKEGVVYSYYGIWNIKDKPKQGVNVFMLDEHVRRTVEKEREHFHKKIARIIDNLKKEVKSMIKKCSEEMKGVHLSINEITQFMCKMMELNELKQPVIEKKKKYVKNKKGEYSKKKKEPEPEDDGYL